jgi:hypothetical protein
MDKVKYQEAVDYINSLIDKPCIFNDSPHRGKLLRVIFTSSVNSHRPVVLCAIELAKVKLVVQEVMYVHMAKNLIKLDIESLAESEVDKLLIT